MCKLSSALTSEVVASIVSTALTSTSEGVASTGVEVWSDCAIPGEDWAVVGVETAISGSSELGASMLSSCFLNKRQRTNAPCCMNQQTTVKIGRI